MNDDQDRELTAEETSYFTEFERKLNEVGKKRSALFFDNSSWVISPEVRAALAENDLEYRAVFDWLRTTMPTT
jgi:hypothetical protein